MKSRLFHHKDPRAASRTGAQSDTDTLSMLSVGAVTLTPEGEITEINARACDELRIRGGGFSHPLNISDILSVCHDRQDLLPGISPGSGNGTATETCRHGAISGFGTPT